MGEKVFIEYKEVQSGTHIPEANYTLVSTEGQHYPGRGAISRPQPIPERNLGQHFPGLNAISRPQPILGFNNTGPSPSAADLSTENSWSDVSITTSTSGSFDSSRTSVSPVWTQDADIWAPTKTDQEILVSKKSDNSAFSPETGCSWASSDFIGSFQSLQESFNAHQNLIDPNTSMSSKSNSSFKSPTKSLNSHKRSLYSPSEFPQKDLPYLYQEALVSPNSLQKSVYFPTESFNSHNRSAKFCPADTSAQYQDIINRSSSLWLLPYENQPTSSTSYQNYCSNEVTHHQNYHSNEVTHHQNYHPNDVSHHQNYHTNEVTHHQNYHSNEVAHHQNYQLTISNVSRLSTQFDQKQTTKNTKKLHCAYCDQNKDTLVSHKLYEMVNGERLIVCPILSKVVCPYCKATGIKAHSKNYCPLNPNKTDVPLVKKLFSSRNSSNTNTKSNDMLNQKTAQNKLSRLS